MRRKGVLCPRGTVFALIVTVGVGLSIFEPTMAGQAPGGAVAPSYRAVPLWPRPFADDSWVIGSVTAVTTDAQNHIWVAHRGADTLEPNEKGMMNNPPTSSVCCMAAPFVLEFDTTGKLLASWGGPSVGYQWPQATGGIAVDAKGNVWITAAGLEPAPAGAARGRGAAPGAAPATPAPPPPIPDAHVLKFTGDGRYVMTIGTPGKMDGPESQTTLNRPAGITYDAAANEVFVADTGNRRIIVFDADTGTYKRHWFAYGEKAAGAAPGPYSPNDPPAKSFRDVTCVKIGKDGMVYVCDKSSNRIQVFDKSGKFIKEAVVSKNTLGGVIAGSFGVLNTAGAVWDLAFSSDPQQRYVFVANGQDKKVLILQRDTLAPIGSIGTGGRYPGQFLAVDSVAVDSQGNLYTGEHHHGKRVQKFVPGK